MRQRDALRTGSDSLDRFGLASIIGRRRSKGLLLGGAMMLGWAISAPAAASTPEDLCTASRTAVAADEPQLSAAAADVESGLAEPAGRQAAAILARLTVPAGTGRPGPRPLASYCLAAGEAMRVLPEGNDVQARRYLCRALALARDNNLSDIAASAAYRFALSSFGELSLGGSRGARAARSASKGISDEPAPLPAADGLSACNGLSEARRVGLTGSDLVVPALRCAEEQAVAANNPALATLAVLRLAHQQLERAGNGADGAAYRTVSRSYALQALAYAKSAPESVSAQLVARATQAAFDADRQTVSPAMRDASNWLRGSSDREMQAWGYALAGEAAAADGRASEATGLVRQAISIEAGRERPTNLPRWLLLLARVDPTNRKAHAMAAYQALENLRPILPRLDPLTEDSTFQTIMQPVFQLAAEMSLGGGGTADPAAIDQTQHIVEAYRQAEIQSLFGTDCIAAAQPIEPRQLASGEVLVYPLLFEDHVSLLVARGGGDDASYKLVQSPFAGGRDEVRALTSAMVYAVIDGDHAGWRKPARTLYDALIAPIAPMLPQDATLVIVPDGPLRALPFAALLDADSRFLIERVRPVIAPALAYAQPGERHASDRPRVLAAALDKEVDLPAGQFPALTGTVEEAEAAAGAEAGRRNLVLTNFKEAELETALRSRPVDILHLATHASFNGGSDRSFIVADDELIPLKRLREIVSENRARGEALDLLVLSACETAVGDDETNMGLAGAAIQSGAQGALASLWQVNDAGTAELMTKFYQSYRSGAGRAESLRQAQLAMLHSSGSAADPYVWASFTLLGAWR